ncbi:hypothetical protein NM688_g4036 [Phlebia brevispora]|uniref:Uncharacterized protein n=1 Tax=Phlebia brevispora TaxID=194682 RepID=A0ACC1T453_9APHY|nr:hypothetical protein NM688_g4036 [Phlebia brevispora]
MNHITSGATAQAGFSTAHRGEKDPYRYQVGFGNSFASEAIPGTLPVGQNSPQKCKYDLYAEGINGTPFTMPRGQNERTWFYRIRPSVAHKGFTKAEQNPNLEAEFTISNPKVHVTPTQLSWHPFEVPKASAKSTFVHGLKTVMGNGSPMQREGVVIHVYAANASMENQAFVNSDGDFLIVPVDGRLDIQTEMGRFMVRPGEFAVLQRGIKWKVTLPDGTARGYVQEIFGSHYELPELGPLGANGLANVRDFEHPVASFDIDQTPWDVIYKLGGQLFVCRQDHTPFDVVAWHGNYVPYKYDMDAFITVASVSKDHMDPSIWTVLTAKSKTPGVALAEFAILKGRWDVATGTFRPPYYHRNTCCEILGLVCGEWPGRSDSFRPGGLSFETGFCPHGPDATTHKVASEMDLVPMRVMDGTILLIFETAMTMAITDYAMNCSNLQEYKPWMFNDLEPNFLKHTDQINADLKAAGLPPLGRQN